MNATQNIPNGAGCELDEKRKQLKTRQRNWLGQSPRNSARQHQIAPGMEDQICTGDFVSLNAEGKLAMLSKGTQFAGVVIGVALNPQGNPVGSVRVGKLWEPVEGLGPHTEKGITVYADPENQGLNLVQGIPVGKLLDKEEFAGGWRAHVELEPNIVTQN